jgi:hypothetical protein
MHIVSGADLALWRYRLVMREFLKALIQDSANRLLSNRCKCKCWTITLKFENQGGITAANLLPDVLGDELGNKVVGGEHYSVGTPGWTVYWDYVNNWGRRDGISIRVCRNTNTAGAPPPSGFGGSAPIAPNVTPK